MAFPLKSIHRRFRPRPLSRATYGSCARSESRTTGFGLLALGVKLAARHLRLHHQSAGVRVGKIHQRAAAQALVASGHLVVTVGKAVAVLRLGEQVHPVADGMQQHPAVLEARQVQVTSVRDNEAGKVALTC